MKKRVLYIMHIPWGWIKQRPHFFAEYLSKYSNVELLYKKPLVVRKRNLVGNNTAKNNIKVRGYHLFPLDHIPLISNLKLDFLNIVLLRLQFGSLKNIDYIWLTSPNIYLLIKPLIPKKVSVVYDCMDDILEFPNIKKNRYAYNKYYLSEYTLLKDADIVFCSSSYLIHKLKDRYAINRNYTLINNAVKLPDSDVSKRDNKTLAILSRIVNLSNVFMYIGTISEWFDFDLIIEVLKQGINANFVLIGPSDVAIPQHPNIHYMGPIQRDSIFEIMNEADFLIMPFKINELIRSVNPVKIYEYIYADKPIIVPHYEEMEYFSSYVFMYNNVEQFSALVIDGINGKLENTTKCVDKKDFLLRNTWDERGKQMWDAINSLK